jgi:hypothetical protein
MYLMGSQFRVFFVHVKLTDLSCSCDLSLFFWMIDLFHFKGPTKQLLISIILGKLMERKVLEIRWGREKRNAIFTRWLSSWMRQVFLYYEVAFLYWILDPWSYDGRRIPGCLIGETRAGLHATLLTESAFFPNGVLGRSIGHPDARLGKPTSGC